MPVEVVGSLRRTRELPPASPFSSAAGGGATGYAPPPGDDNAMELQSIGTAGGGGWTGRRRRLSLWASNISSRPSAIFFWFNSPADFLTFCYMTLTLPLYFVRFSSPGWFVFHLAVMAFCPAARLVLYPLRERKWAYIRVGRVHLSWLQWLLDLFPILIFFYLYQEVSVLNQAIHKGRLFDDVVTGWEEKLFHGQPSQELRTLLPNKVLGEFLSFCYFSLYPIIVSFPLGLYLKDRVAFSKGVGALVLTFYMGFLGFICFPVEGPYWFYGPPRPSSIGYYFAEIVHFLVSGGSSNGTAFPSSHVGISVSAWLLAYRYHPGLFKFYTLVVPGLAVSTVHGGFHYAIDAICGLFYGAFCAVLGHYVVAKLHTQISHTRNDFRDLDEHTAITQQQQRREDPEDDFA